MKTRHRTLAGFACLVTLLCGFPAGATFAEPPAHAAGLSAEPRMLNNLVTELLQSAPEAKLGSGTHVFTNPRDGWVFFRTTAVTGKDGGAIVSLDGVGENDVIAKHGVNGPQTIEAMHWLSNGKHTLTIRCEGSSSLSGITVRAVPALVYAVFPDDPNRNHIVGYPEFTWNFLKKAGIWDNINTIVAGEWTLRTPEVTDFVRQGGRLWENVNLPGAAGSLASTGSTRAYDVFSETLGMTSPLFSGLIMDEVGEGKGFDENFENWYAAFRRLLAQHKERTLCPYVSASPNGVVNFVQPMIEEERFYFALECYLWECRNEAEAEKTIDTYLVKSAKTMEVLLPGVQKKMIVALGVFSAPASLNNDPAADFKVYLDMQMHHLANDPVFKDLFGIEGYISAYTDEEYLRWLPKLYRHYCIEGCTDRLSHDPYTLSHVENPDFEKGLDEWTVSAAEPGSIQARTLPGYGHLEARFPTCEKGDTFCWMKRSAAKANRVSQTIKGLTPGRTYSIKMYAFDAVHHAHPERLAIDVRIESAQMVPDRCFDSMNVSTFDDPAYTKASAGEPAAREENKRVYYDYYRLVFRATSETATLTISDWVLSNSPHTGPIGQELIFNFIEVEPYLMPAE